MNIWSILLLAATVTAAPNALPDAAAKSDPNAAAQYGINSIENKKKSANIRVVIVN